MIPTPPRFTRREVEQLVCEGDWLVPAFEWLRFVGLLAAEVCSLSNLDPKAIRRPEIHYAVLRGLLNRCSRMILADVKLAAERRHGEVVALFTRCICESAITARWLMTRDEPELFRRYVASGLRSDLELKKNLLSNIDRRGGTALVIEERMIDSIARCLELGEMTEEEVWSTKRMYTFEAICRDLDLPPEGYTVLQRISSHAIHGSWTDLLFHYLESKGDAPLGPREGVNPPDPKHLAAVALEVLAALGQYVRFMVGEAEAKEALGSVCSSSRSAILDILDIVSVDDYEVASAP